MCPRAAEHGFESAPHRFRLPDDETQLGDGALRFDVGVSGERVQRNKALEVGPNGPGVGDERREEGAGAACM